MAAGHIPPAPHDMVVCACPRKFLQQQVGWYEACVACDFFVYNCAAFVEMRICSDRFVGTVGGVCGLAGPTAETNCAVNGDYIA